MTTTTVSQSPPAASRRGLRAARWLVILGVVIAAVVWPAGSASASMPRVTHGEAQAVFQAVGNAGLVIQRHAPVQMGAPQAARMLAEIRPLSFEGFDGRHYCAEDWHVIVIALIYGGDASYTRPHAQAELDTLTILTLTLDGAVLPITSTPLKPYSAPDVYGFVQAWWTQYGRVMSPTDLSVGTHTLSLFAVDDLGAFADAITFYVDKAGEGACL